MRDLTAAVRRDLAALARQDASLLRLVRRRYSEALRGESSEVAARFPRGYEHRLAARVRREVRNTLTTGVKNPSRRRGKKPRAPA